MSRRCRDTTGDVSQIVSLAQTQKGRACAALILQALSSKKIFTFGELLSVQSIAELSGSDFNNSWETLNLFAYGTYCDYKGNKAKYLELSAFQILKLKQLSILSSAQEQKILKYSELLQGLDISTVRELEDMITQLIYSGLILGKFDQQNKIFRVSDVIARDVPLTALSDIISNLEAWREACGSSAIAMTKCSQIIDNARITANEEKKHVESTIVSLKAAKHEATTAAGLKDISGDYDDSEDRDQDDPSIGFGSWPIQQQTSRMGRSLKRIRGIGEFSSSSNDESRNL